MTALTQYNFIFLNKTNIVEVRQLRSRGCNVYFLERDGESFLIDTGTPASGRLIESQIKSVDGILITHAHFDHIGSAAFLQKKFGCEVFAHERDLPYLRGIDKLKYSGFLGKFASFAEKFFRVEYPKVVKSIDEIAEVFSTEEIKDANNKDFAVIHTPGHTPGSVCIKVREKLICGDLFRKRRKVGLSPKAFCSDYSAYLNSIKAVMTLDFIFALPGHGSSITKEEIEVVSKL